MDESLAQEVRDRARGVCEYCHLPDTVHDIPFEIDHIIAQKHHGPTVSSKLLYSCLHCNRHKGTDLAGLDPKTKKLTRLFNPRRHLWSRHFRWAGPILVGKTPVGRTTVDVLAMNDPVRVALRQQLIDEGLYPPS
jgi:5-methylcytosine-specific restriction endonuclease McrA